MLAAAAASLLCFRQCSRHLWVVLHLKQLWQQLASLALYAQAAHAAVACGLQIQLNNRRTPGGGGTSGGVEQQQQGANKKALWYPGFHRLGGGQL